MESRRKRVIVGKLGLDSHDNGLRIISKWLMDSGYEVVYAGLYNTTKRIIETASEEGADAIGISFLGGEHLFYTEEMIEELKKGGMYDMKLIVGGVIPPDDARYLKTKGVDAVFTPGTSRENILREIHNLFTQTA